MLSDPSWPFRTKESTAQMKNCLRIEATVSVGLSVGGYDDDDDDDDDDDLILTPSSSQIHCR